jgi:hypothetical protein
MVSGRAWEEVMGCVFGFELIRFNPSNIGNNRAHAHYNNRGHLLILLRELVHYDVGMLENACYTDIPPGIVRQ